MSAPEGMTHDDFLDVLKEAFEQGWVSNIACSTHDGVPMTEGEDAEFIEGYDPCIPVIRLYEVG